MPPTYIFYDDVVFITCRGIVNGYADGTFQPNKPTNRGQFSKIVVNGFGIAAHTPTSPTFSDVPSNHPFYRYIEAAAHAGVMIGYADHTFQPGRNVNRIETVVTIQRIRHYAIYAPATATFRDVIPGSFGYAETETLVQVGVISGQPCSMGSGLCFRTYDDIIRGEMAKVAHRAMQTAP